MTLTLARWILQDSNYAMLSPISLLKRVERTFPNHVASIHGRKQQTWKEMAVRSR